MSDALTCRVLRDRKNYGERRRVQLWNSAPGTSHGEAPEGRRFSRSRFQHCRLGESHAFNYKVSMSPMNTVSVRFSIVNLNFCFRMQANALRAEGRPEDIFDENILGAVLDEDLLTTLNIALQCTNEMPKTRPNMHHIVKMLQRLQGEDDYSFCSSRNLSHKISLDSQFSLSSSNTASSDSPRAFYSCDVV